MEKYGPADIVFHIQKVEVIKCNHCMCKRSHSILQQNMLSVFQYGETKMEKHHRFTGKYTIQHCSRVQAGTVVQMSYL